jgi:hypothetical protein
MNRISFKWSFGEDKFCAWVERKVRKVRIRGLEDLRIWRFGKEG